MGSKHDDFTWRRLAETMYNNAIDTRLLATNLADQVDPVSKEPIDFDALQLALRKLEENLGAMKGAAFAMGTVLKRNANGRKGVH